MCSASSVCVHSSFCVICYVCRPDNLYKPENLNTFKASGDILLDVCTAGSPVQLMLDRNSNKVRDCFTCKHAHYGS